MPQFAGMNSLGAAHPSNKEPSRRQNKNMKNLYKLAFILVIGAAFAFAQTQPGQGSPSTPSTYPSQQQPGAQAPDNSPMGQSGTSSAATSKAQSDIQSALRKQMPASADNVTVSVTGENQIELSGTVSSDSEKTQVEQIAQSAAPTATIVNHLKVSSSTSGSGAMPPQGSQPPAAGKPPLLRLVAYQQTGQDSPSTQPQTGQDPQSTQNPNNPTSSSPGAGAGQTADANNNGSDVQDKIQKAIQQDSSLASSNIMVNVSNNKVELTGTVASKDQKRTARQIAESNAGGMKVVDRLKVSGSETSPSSPSTPPKN
jgi:osmotically-inducible protein OsmY